MEEKNENIIGMPEDAIKSLFSNAEKTGGLEYIFTLLRVTGLTSCKDPLLALDLIIRERKYLSSDLLTQSSLFVGIEELLSLIGNLLNCSNGKTYKHCFFFPLYKGSFPNITKPSIEQMLKNIKNLSELSNQLEIKNLLEKYSLSIFFEKTTSDSLNNYEMAEIFLNSFITVYKNERMKFKEKAKLYKLQNFEVLELLVDETVGLYGFYLHFSNGGSAQFIRKESSTLSQNISFDRNFELSSFVGDLHALTEEWVVGKKKLYEIGLPGRYNVLGQWKPLIYPERKQKVISRYAREALSLSKDEQVQGVLFYIMCTSHHVIEFVVKADLELPWENTTLGKVIHLWKCPNSQMMQNFFIYDGSYCVNSFDPDEIEMAISTLNLTLNTIAFAYNAKLQWRLKYKIVNGTQNSFIKLNEEDMNVLDNILNKYPRNKDGLILNSAIDWYNRGTNSKDIFASFLCYYRVIEIIVTSVYSGKAEFGLRFQAEKRDQAKQKSISCIEKKYNELFESDKFRFITSAYSECIQGTKYKTEQILDLIFGKDNIYIKNLFKKTEEEIAKSLYEIRNGIAHGSITFLEREDVELVRSKISDIKMIAKELILRLVYSLNPSETLAEHSERRGMKMSGYDPRTYFYSNTENVFPKDVDWMIKPEWCS
ncbi:MAG: hypothetical protein A2Y10_01540 [Planctomycetes bacterium GWF2_41_51]|nr:MAG: hypothetical protein A2Y10_01540 [Planctomycetes bacterium GWF2_41_51]HBG25473.1 hypothetical protein [Phycisphaerales bacterium]